MRKISGRRWLQISAVFIANPWIAYFWSRLIYQGGLKGVCFPGFNCYACPLALYSCPIGSLQHGCAMIHDKQFSAPAAALHKGWAATIAPFLYVAAFIGLIGVVTGRLVCGWFCPFGLLQDVLYRIPTKKFSIPRWAHYGKYVALGLLAMLIPYLTGVHWFSRLCPAGALEGAVPLKVIPPNAQLPEATWFFWLKIAILVAFLAWMVLSKRPFCRTMCPLGAAYALLQPISLYRMRVDRDRCTECGECRQACPVDIDIYKSPNSPECIRCLECKKACPEDAITSGFFLRGKPEGSSAAEEKAGAHQAR